MRLSTFCYFDQTFWLFEAGCAGSVVLYTGYSLMNTPHCMGHHHTDSYIHWLFISRVSAYNLCVVEVIVGPDGMWA